MGLHHLVCQSLVAICGTPHAATNAAILPHSVALLAGRAPAAFAPLAGSLGVDPDGLADRIAALGGPLPLAALGGDPGRVEEAVEAMLARRELASVPDPPDRTELRALVDAAWNS
jgi:maleylacetate reductase